MIIKLYNLISSVITIFCNINWKWKILQKIKKSDYNAKAVINNFINQNIYQMEIIEKEEWINEESDLNWWELYLESEISIYTSLEDIISASKIYYDNCLKIKLQNIFMIWSNNQNIYIRRTVWLNCLSTGSITYLQISSLDFALIKFIFLSVYI